MNQTPQGAPARAVKSMRDARQVVIPRATHNVHSDNPGDFARALDDFLSSRAETGSTNR